MELIVQTTRNAPTGCTTQSSAPQAGTFCRSYTFTPPIPPTAEYLITFALEPMRTFGGDRIKSF